LVIVTDPDHVDVLPLCCTECFSGALEPLGVPLSAHAAPINGKCHCYANQELKLSGS